MTKYILLSLDVEEFDLPREYGLTISDEDALKVSLNGLINIIELIERHQIKITIFTTAFFALHNSELIKSLSNRHEIACHDYSHSHSSMDSELKAKKVIEDIIGKKVIGYRQPRLGSINYLRLSQMGFIYDSSINPTWIPGRYNNLNKPRKPFNSQDLWIIPISVSPIVRFPLFWLSLKNLPEFIYKTLAQVTLDYDGFLSIYLHPWEFSDLSKYQIPFYIKRHSGRGMLQRLERLILFLKERGDFISISQYIDHIQ